MMRQNLVAHCQKGSADKIYMACIRVDNTTGKFTVIGKWGRRGTANLQQQVKLQTSNENAAVAEQRRLFEAKLKKGYVDIESPAYRGPLHGQSPDIRANLEGGTPIQQPRKTPVRKTPTPKPAAPVDDEPIELIVECLDNAGIEHQFDKGIEYVAELHTEPGLVWVYDKLGEKQECFTERFKKVADA